MADSTHQPSGTADGPFACTGRGETECKILAAAFALFREQGIHATTTRKIAEAAGVNEVTLFRNFGSKDGLLQAIVETQLADKQKMIAQIDAWNGDPADEIRILGTMMWTMIHDRREWMQIVVRNVHLYPQLAVIIDRFRQPLYETIVRYFERHIKAGRLRAVEPRLAATMLVGPLMSMRLSFDTPARLVPAGITPEQVFDFHIESYLSYLLPERQPVARTKGKKQR